MQYDGRDGGKLDREINDDDDDSIALRTQSIDYSRSTDVT